MRLEGPSRRIVSEPVEAVAAPPPASPEQPKPPVTAPAPEPEPAPPA